MIFQSKQEKVWTNCGSIGTLDSPLQKNLWVKSVIAVCCGGACGPSGIHWMGLWYPMGNRMPPLGNTFHTTCQYMSYILAIYVTSPTHARYMPSTYTNDIKSLQLSFIYI